MLVVSTKHVAVSLNYHYAASTRYAAAFAAACYARSSAHVFLIASVQLNLSACLAGL